MRCVGKSLGWSRTSFSASSRLFAIAALTRGFAIAAEICITEKTVEFHLTNIYTKIGMRTRMLAGLWAMQQGIEAETREIPS